MQASYVALSMLDVGYRNGILKKSDSVSVAGSGQVALSVSKFNRVMTGSFMLTISTVFVRIS
jgi:hypothetical protein